MAWKFARIGRAEARRAFLVVRNAASENMSTGRAAFWYWSCNAATGYTFDGYSVTYNSVTATLQLPLGMFVGPVANRDIPIGEYGEVQLYGPHLDGLVFSGVSEVTASGFLSEFFMTNITYSVADLATVLLRPLAAAPYGIATAGISQGVFGVMSQVATSSWTNFATVTKFTIPFATLLPGGYAIPLANPAATATYASTLRLPAFVRCL
jgi:hypothetical protein